MGQSDIIGDVGIDWKDATKETLVKEYPLLVSALWNEYNMMLSRLANEAMSDVQGKQKQEVQALTAKLANICPTRANEMQAEKEELFEALKFDTCQQYSQQEHIDVCPF
jgi:hypothetical protein